MLNFLKIKYGFLLIVLFVVCGALFVVLQSSLGTLVSAGITIGIASLFLMLSISKLIGTTSSRLGLTNQNNVLKKKVDDLERHLDISQKIAKVGSWEVDISSVNIPWGKPIWTKELKKMMGLKPTDDVPKPDYIEEHMHPDDKHLFKQENEKLRTSDTQTEVIYRISDFKGGWRWYRSTGRRWHIKDENIIRILGTLQDITPFREKEIELEESNRELKEVMRALSGREQRMIELKERIANLEKTI